MSDSVLFHAAKVENTCYSGFKQIFHLCYNYDIAHFFVVLYNKVTFVFCGGSVVLY